MKINLPDTVFLSVSREDLSYWNVTQNAKGGIWTPQCWISVGPGKSDTLLFFPLKGAEYFANWTYVIGKN